MQIPRFLEKLLKPLIPRGFGWQRTSARYNHVLSLERELDKPAETANRLSNCVVSACVTWIRDQLGKVKIEVVTARRDGQQTPVYNHEFVKVWNNPSGIGGEGSEGLIDPIENLEQLISDWLVCGNAYLQKIRSQSGAVVGFRALSEWRVQPRWAQNGDEWIGYYEVDLDGSPIPVSPREIIHFRDGRDPLNERKGRSRLDAGDTEIDAYNTSVEYTATLVREGGAMGVVFTKPNVDADPIGAEAADSLKALFRERRGKKRFEPVVIDTDARANTWGLSPEQMRLDRIPLNLELSIASLIGINPKVYGGAASQLDSTYANNKEAKEGAWSRVAAILGRLAAALTTQCLVPDFGGDQRASVRFNLDGVEAIQEQTDQKVDRAVKLYGTPTAPGLCTRNEAREIVGLDALPPEVGDRFADGRDLTGKLAEEPKPVKTPELFA